MRPVFVFDAYGTLFDVHAAIASHREAVGPDADRLSGLWREKQLEYTWTLTLADRYVDFWTLTEHSLDYALSRVPTVDRALKPRLLAAYRTLGAFADAAETLAQLKSADRRTAILSNGTPEMLDAAVEAAKLRPMLDTVLSVATVRKYKPRREVYQLVIDTFAVAPADILFVSSNRWDVMGALTFGFRAAWINRGGAPEEYGERPPTYVFTDLRRLGAMV
jgi:2-haloacid dehalogenase